MYTNIETLPNEVKATLDPAAQGRWLNAYNNSIKKSAKGNHRLAMLNAWSDVRDSPSCRLFGAFVSSDRLDKQNDTVDVQKVYERISNQIERGGTITDTHSNRVVGSFIYADMRKTATGHNGVYAYGVIYNGEPYFDSTWSAIKKAVECPDCRDSRKGTSIGGFALDTNVECANGACHRVIKDMSIHEISICHEPANDDAMINYINMIAKSSDELSSDGGILINKAVETFDPRANEAPQPKPEGEMQAQAQANAQGVQENEQAQQQQAQPQSLGQLVGAGQPGQEEAGQMPTVEEMRNFKKKIVNAKKMIKELASIVETVNSLDLDTQMEAASEPQNPQGQAQPQQAPEGTVAKGIISGVANTIGAGIDAFGGAMNMAATGDIAGMAGAPGKIAGGASNVASSFGKPKPTTPTAPTAPTATDTKNLAANQNSAMNDATNNEAPSAPSTTANQASAKADAANSSIAPDPAQTKVDSAMTKSSCGCMDKEKHTPITSKKCPMDKELYGDEEDPSKLEYLENKELDEKVKIKGDSGMVDAAKIKGEKTADEGPSMKTKEEKKLPENVMKKSFDVATAEQLISVLKAFIDDNHIKEDMKEEDKIVDKADEIKDVADDMKSEDKEAMEKCSMTQEQFKAKYDPKPVKASEASAEPVEKSEGHGMTEKEFKAKYEPKPEKAKDNGKNENKQMGKEGKNTILKSETNEAYDDETLADGNVGEENSENLIEGVEAIAGNAAQSQEMSAQQLIQLVMQFLQQQGISVQNPPLENPQIEGEIAKEPEGPEEEPGVTQEDVDFLESNPDEMAKAVFLGSFAMQKLRARFLKNRLELQQFSATDML